MDNLILNKSLYLISVVEDNTTDELRNSLKKDLSEMEDSSETKSYISSDIISIVVDKLRNGKISSVDDAINTINKEFQDLELDYFDMSIEEQPMRTALSVASIKDKSFGDKMDLTNSIFEADDKSKIKIAHSLVVLDYLSSIDIVSNLDRVKELSTFLSNTVIDNEVSFFDFLRIYQDLMN